MSSTVPRLSASPRLVIDKMMRKVVWGVPKQVAGCGASGEFCWGLLQACNACVTSIVRRVGGVHLPSPLKLELRLVLPTVPPPYSFD